MPTLYVRDVPSELYERLRREAAAARRSLSAETIELLRRALAPGRSGVSLEQLLKGADRIRERHPLPAGSPTAAELIREDRERQASLAIAHSLTAQDAVYAALAVQLGGIVVSGDGRFVERGLQAGLPVVAVTGG